jgi:ABC-type uncharacterized transport system substrate-binding protein
MRRRELLALISSAAVAWPLAARAQQGERMRRIGVLMPLAADDPEAQLRLAALAQGLQQLGWTIGRNVRIETRWSAGNADDIRKYAVELAALAPDVILANGGAAVAPLLQATRALPIVFVVVPDPVGSGFVDSLARPGGNASSGARPATSIASSRARSRPTCRCRRPPSSSWSSTSRPPRRSASTYPRRCSLAPTR